MTATTELYNFMGNGSWDNSHMLSYIHPQEMSSVDFNSYLKYKTRTLKKRPRNIWILWSKVVQSNVVATSHL